jgi:hypothetical protein
MGTALGLLAAIALFIGSFIFGDDSTTEAMISKRGEELPREWERKLMDSATSYKRSGHEAKSTNARQRKGKGVIERAMEDSLRRDEHVRRQSPKTMRPVQSRLNDSDEDDDLGNRQHESPNDYFFGYSGLPHGATRKDKSSPSTR